MKIWHVHRTDQCSYDEYDSFVVAAETEQQARLAHPSGGGDVWTGREWRNGNWKDTSWPAPGKLKVREIGTAAPTEKAGVICASFNAG